MAVKAVTALVLQMLVCHSQEQLRGTPSSAPVNVRRSPDSVESGGTGNVNTTPTCSASPSMNPIWAALIAPLPDGAQHSTESDSSEGSDASSITFYVLWGLASTGSALLYYAWYLPWRNRNLLHSAQVADAGSGVL
jgi:hypothetical protein